MSLLLALLQVLPGSSLDAHAGEVRQAAWTPDGKLLLTLGDGELRIWIAASRRLLHAVPAADRFAISPDGAWTATAGAVYATATGERRAAFDPGRLSALAWNGASFVTATPIAAGLSVRTRDVDGRELASFAIPTGRRSTLVAVHAGRLAFGAADLSVRVWDVAEKRERARLEGPTDRLTALEIDGPRTVAACADGQVRFWVDGRLVRTLEGGGPAAWSGDRAVVLGADGLELWNSADWTRQGVFAGPGTGVWTPSCVVFPPTGRLAAGGTLIAKVAVAGRKVSGPVYFWR